VRQLVAEGKAYPCFLTEDEISEIRTKQEALKLTPGIYGEYAKYRDISPVEAEKHIAAGESYVVRLRSDGIPDSGRTVTIVDGIRGELSFPENIMDVVLLKSDGVPTYHFAHAVDDHLMRTTHVIRGEEWLSSLPIHVALFEALGFELPTYCHSTVLMKMDGDKKRKLSKRHDPELSLEYYRKLGYHPAAIAEYLMTIINSNFEEWRAENPDAPLSDFRMTTEKMSVSGILFDLDKLADVSKETLVRMPASEIADFLISWAKLFRPEFYHEIAETSDKDYLEAVLDIGRSGEKPRKDLAYAAQIAEHISYMYDAEYEAAVSENIPENVQPEDAKQILEAYLETYNHSDDRETWFAKIREFGEKLGYAPKPKEYKKNPELYKGHVGDVSTVIRLALTKRSNSPDIYEIQQILGEERVRLRITQGDVLFV
jgi:glutamyl-tRNA synthetase